MRKFFRVLSTICFLSIFALCTMSAALAQAGDIARIKLVDNNHIPQKVVVVMTSGTNQFCRDLFATIKLINETGSLPAEETVKMHVIKGSSSLDVVKTLGISTEDAKKYLEINEKFSSYDIWAQDCMELCSAIDVNGSVFPAVFDSNRGRGLGALPKVLSEMWQLKYFKNPSGSQAHGDYGGNLEVVPNEDIMVAGDTITASCKAYFEKMGYAGRLFTPDTKWLNVGHIDEYLNYIPTLNAPNGYSIVKADPAYALDLVEYASDEDFAKLESSDRSFLLKVRAALKAQRSDPSAAKGTSEGDFIELNLKIAEIIEKNVGELKSFITTVNNKENSRFGEVAWPCLYQGYNPANPSSCHAFLPGVVNLTVLRDHLLVPATYFPPFDKIVESRFRAQGNKVHFIDDSPYHSAMGEIHCGTNVIRSLDKLVFTKSQISRVNEVKNVFEKVHKE
ncbi:MAG: hypothetical protein HQM10_06975 [Candidatus Riflebacteria bacterium]|nr:hypothetical protein [Candidatus Riflebacteria bacterium]